MGSSSITERLCTASALAVGLAAASLPALAGGTPPPFSIPNVPAAASPYFDGEGGLRLVRAGGAENLDLTVTGMVGSVLLHLSPTLDYAVQGSFTLQARFIQGVVTSGSLSVTGTVPGYDGPGTPAPEASQLLYRADLVSFGSTYDSGTYQPLQAAGFRAAAGTGWASQFTDGSVEGVYLYGFPVLSFVEALQSTTTALYTASQVSVWITLGGPLPAVPETPRAALLAAGLLVLAARRHRRRWRLQHHGAATPAPASNSALPPAAAVFTVTVCSAQKR
jgi:hypothetical protein